MTEDSLYRAFHRQLPEEGRRIKALLQLSDYKALFCRIIFKCPFKNYFVP
jgi:hypothetical protein